jgi:hypothetical protein
MWHTDPLGVVGVVLVDVVGTHKADTSPVFDSSPAEDVRCWEV